MGDRRYTVSKTKDGEYWYVHRAGYSHIPVLGTFHKTKKAAQKDAAGCMAMSYEDYMKLPERKGVK